MAAGSHVFQGGDRKSRYPRWRPKPEVHLTPHEASKVPSVLGMAISVGFFFFFYYLFNNKNNIEVISDYHFSTLVLMLACAKSFQKRYTNLN